jgi:hypothetical protein
MAVLLLNKNYIVSKSKVYVNIQSLFGALRVNCRLIPGYLGLPLKRVIVNSLVRFMLKLVSPGATCPGVERICE